MSDIDSSLHDALRDAPVGLARDPEAGRSGPKWNDICTRDQSGLTLTLRNGRPLRPSNWRRHRRQIVLKRLLLDIPVAGLALVGLSPLLLLLAIAVKATSPGPIFFRQPRVGMGGRSFSMLKFRSMRTDAGDLSGVKQTVANDTRLTPIGRFLRATSIDELPQLWNVLRGDMSLIGPRPMVAGQLAGGQRYREVVPYYDYRFLVKPGLSGWAQANGLRGSTEDLAAARARIDHDCAYVQNLSVGLDLLIVMKTLKQEFLTGSGY